MISSKTVGDRVESEVIQEIDGLRWVGDAEEEWYDARPERALWPSDVSMGSTPCVSPGQPVEIKAAMPRLASGERGRWFIRRRQHGRLLETGAVYLLVVYDPRDQTVLAMRAVPASIVDELLKFGGREIAWIDVDVDRSETGYKQLTWTHVFDVDEVNRGGRR